MNLSVKSVHHLRGLVGDQLNQNSKNTPPLPIYRLKNTIESPIVNISSAMGFDFEIEIFGEARIYPDNIKTNNITNN